MKINGTKRLIPLEISSLKPFELVLWLRIYKLRGRRSRKERHVLTVVIPLKVGKVIQDKSNILDEVESWRDDGSGTGELVSFWVFERPCKTRLNSQLQRLFARQYWDNRLIY